ncbi:MAG: rod shape-determining protein RodA, partial [Clostridia bacterium]|nr:rod shape-determining protein RodA [Clostridia bacterium]
STSSGDEYLKQIMWVGISLAVMFVVWLLDYHVSSIIGAVGYPICLILLVIVLFMPEINGASSWFSIGSVQIQPSEFMKIAYILLFAKYIDYVYTKGKDAINKWYYIGLALCIFAIPVILIMLQPDFGTALVFASITFFMLFKSGLSYKYVFALILVILIAAPLLYFFVLSEYQQERIQVFFNPEQEPLGAGYNAIQSKIAVGSGMLFGTGLTKGTQTQWGYLPVKSSDFIFSVISEEMGFVMSAIIVVMYVAILLRILRVAETSKDRLGSTRAIGVFGMFFFHFLENFGMTIGLMPITGIPLPFVSYGGSSMLTNFIALGLVLCISSRRQKSLFVE